MKLIIVESPTKARTVSRYVGDEFEVRASVGHVRDLPKSNKKALDLENDFKPNYEIVPGKEEILKELGELAETADEILLATDPDREGEAIAWHLVQALELDPKKTKRVVFHEITESAILEALKHPRPIDEHLRKAQEARRVLDRLFGYDLSGLIWKKVRYGLSAGRVQSPALRILMEREREIRAFEPEDYFVLSADLTTPKKEKLTLTCVEEPRDEKWADEIYAAGEKESWRITEVKASEAKRAARAPFTTSTLQQAASTRLGFAPSRTMRAAQRLYEAGHITYMRTDSTNMSTEAQKQILGLVKKKYGEDYVAGRVYKTKSKSAQEAHEAVRPTTVSKEKAGNSDDQKRLYELIWQRAVASQMADAKLERTKITARVETESIPEFTITGSRVIFDGWLAADPGARGEDVELPKVAEGESLILTEMHCEAKQTQPPSRYSEAGLIKELEKRGIGRPSTYASIMKTLVDRGYVEKEGRTLIPTDTGDVVSSFLEQHFDNYISDTFTAEMEDELDEIAEGERGYVETIKEFYDPFTKDIQKKEDVEKLTNLGDAPKEFDCPDCGASMVYKLGRGGKFISCSRFPECTGARTVEGHVLEPDKPIGNHPETGEPIYVLHGRFGPYVQLGEKTKENPKPNRASVPKEYDPLNLSVEDATKLLSLPRVLGEHPDTGKEIVANTGRFGPYIVHDGDFRSLKHDDVYTIDLKRALEILAEPKKTRKKGAKKTTKKASKKATKKTAKK